MKTIDPKEATGAMIDIPKAPPPKRGWACSSMGALRRRIVKTLQELETMDYPDKDSLAKFRTLFYGYSVAAAILRDEKMDEMGKRLDVLEERAEMEGKS